MLSMIAILRNAALVAGVLLLGLALALLPLPLAAWLVLWSGVLLLALIDPLWALCAAVLAVPAQEVALLPGGLSPIQMALLLAAGTWALHIAAHPERPVRGGLPLVPLLLLLWALTLSSALTPYSQRLALTETLRWSTVVLVYLLARNSLRGGPSFRWRVGALVVCLLLAPAANAVFGLWQFVTGSGPESFEIAGGYVRAYGTIGKPNSFAGYLNMGWPLAVALALGAAWMLGRWLLHRPAPARPPLPRLPLLVFLGSGVAAGLLLAALLASFSRGGWVGAAGGAGAMLLGLLLLLEAGWRRRIWRGALAGGVAGALLLVVVGNAGLLPGALTQRVASITNNLRLFDVRTVEVSAENFAVVERMAQIQAAWSMVRAYPLTGVGPGNYTLAYEGGAGFADEPHLLHPWYTSRGHAHNYYLHIAAEAGSVGALAYLLLLLALAWQAVLALWRADGWLLRSISIGGCGIIAAIAVHNLFENLHVLNMGVQMGAVWGLLAAIASRTDEATGRDIA
jgi:O-antigen ligase